MTEKLRILILEDVADDAELQERELQKAGIEFISKCVETREDFLAALEDFVPDIILCDYMLPTIDGMMALKLIRKHSPNVPVIIVTGSMNEETAVECLKAGAADYVIKDHLVRLTLAVKNALNKQLQREIKQRAFRALRESEERHRSLTEAIPDMILLVDREGTYLEYKPSDDFAPTVPAETFLGRKISDVMPKDVTRASIEAIRQALATETLQTFEYELVKEGQLHYFEARAAPNAQGEVSLVIRDITERKEAEEIVERMALRQQLILNSAGQGIVGVDRDGNMTSINPAAASTLGGTISGLLGRPLQPRERDSGPNDRACSDYSSTVDQTLVDGLPREADAIFQKLDGSSFPVRLVCTAIGNDRQIDGAVVVFEDISEKKQREETLSLQGAALEAAANSIVITDPQGVIQWVNLAFTKLTGYTAEEAIGQNPRILQSERQERSFYTELWDTIRAGRTWRGELINKRKNGSLYTEEMTITPVPDSSGNISHFVAIKQDITERKASDETLRKSEESFRNLVQHATYGIYRSSPDGRFLSVNPALVEMLGYRSEEDLLSIDMNKDLYADRGMRQTLIEEFELSKLVDGVETPWLRRDGNPLMVRLSGRPVNSSNGNLECFEMIVENVTARSKLETQLRQAQKMEAIGNLTSGLAHDFNNLLSVIIANTELLTESLTREDLRFLAKDISTAADAGAHMVRQLLGFSRIAVLEMHTINLGKVVADTSSMLKRLIPSNIVIDVTADEKLRAVRADAVLVEQIILNLATNARDAMPDGGNLSIEVRETIVKDDRQPFPWFVPGEYVRVAVRDTGEGMDEATRSKIFEPFFTTKPKGSGTGLGMAMVYGLMKQQGGYILVESEPGIGTTRRALSGERRAQTVARWRDGTLRGRSGCSATNRDAGARAQWLHCHLCCKRPRGDRAIPRTSVRDRHRTLRYGNARNGRRRSISSREGDRRGHTLPDGDRLRAN